MPPSPPALPRNEWPVPLGIIVREPRELLAPTKDIKLSSGLAAAFEDDAVDTAPLAESVFVDPASAAPDSRDDKFENSYDFCMSPALASSSCSFSVAFRRSSASARPEMRDAFASRSAFISSSSLFMASSSAASLVFDLVLPLELGAVDRDHARSGIADSTFFDSLSESANCSIGSISIL